MKGRYARIPGSYWRDRAGLVSLEAHGLYAIGRAYCADQRTDGVIHEQWIAGMCGGKLNKAALSELLGAGWWERTAGGYRDVRYLDENISREKAEERAAKIGVRVARSRARSNGDGNDPGNGPGNAPCNAVTNDVTLDTHDDNGVTRRTESDGRVAIVVAELASAIGAVGGQYVGRAEDRPYLKDAAAAMAASDPSRPLRVIAREWLPDFVKVFRSRTPKNLALYAQSRAANGGAEVKAAAPFTKPSGWMPPADHSQFTDTEITPDLFKLEAAK